MICKSMWRAVFFLDNLIDNGEEQCLPWGWYLQVDFQIFLVCIFILLIYSWKKKIAVIISSVLMVGSWTYNVIFTQQHKIKLFTSIETLLAFQSYFLNIYIKPYARWSPYILGLFLGILYVEYNNQKKIDQKDSLIVKCLMLKSYLEKHWIRRRLIEWLGIGLMAFIAFIPRTLQNGGTWPQILDSLYLCFSRMLFNIGIILVIFPTLLGLKGSFFNTILDTYLFNLVGKISFCAYLLHYIVVTQMLGV